MATLQMNFLSMRLALQENVTVFIPSIAPGQDTAGKSYSELYPKGKKFKTLWLLGDEYGDDSTILNYSGILRIAEKYGFAVVFPCTYEKLYSDDPIGQKFTENISEEVYGVCMGTFPLSRKREDNIIAGFSLGAYGAMKCALTAPDQYGAVVMIGGAYEKDIKNGYFKALKANMKANDSEPHQEMEWAEEDDAELKAEGKDLPKVLVINALQAPLSAFTGKAAENLKADGFDVTEIVKDTKDDWYFRDSALEDAFAWFGKEA